ACGRASASPACRRPNLAPAPAASPSAERRPTAHRSRFPHHEGRRACLPCRGQSPDRGTSIDAIVAASVIVKAGKAPVAKLRKPGIVQGYERCGVLLENTEIWQDGI